MSELQPKNKSASRTILKVLLWLVFYFFSFILCTAIVHFIAEWL